MGTTRFREGNVTITLTDDLERFAREAVDRLLPGVLQRLEAEAQEVLNTARNNWPIKPGRSAAGFRLATEIRNDSVFVAVENHVPYAFYVRPREWFGADTAWNREVKKPMRKVAQQIVREMGDVTADALRRA